MLGSPQQFYLYHLHITKQCRNNTNNLNSKKIKKNYTKWAEILTVSFLLSKAVKSQWTLRNAVTHYEVFQFKYAANKQNSKEQCKTNKYIGRHKNWYLATTNLSQANIFLSIILPNKDWVSIFFQHQIPSKNLKLSHHCWRPQYILNMLLHNSEIFVTFLDSRKQISQFLHLYIT